MAPHADPERPIPLRPIHDPQGDAGRVRIVVALPHAIDRGAMIALLAAQPGFDVVGAAATGEETLHRCRDLLPAVLLLDVHMPDVDGVPLITAAHAAAAETGILALAAHDEARCLVLHPVRGAGSAAHGVECGLGTDCLQLAILRGASGAIRRAAEPAVLFQAVRAVSAGQAWLESATALRVLLHAFHARAGDDARAMSPRDREVAALIADGRCNKEIGCALGIGEPTVKKHVGRILERLGVQDRLQIGLHVTRHPELLEPLRALRD